MMREADWVCLWEAHAHVGEGTIWDERDGCIYWVDINPAAPSVNWFELATGRTRTWVPPMWLSALAIRASGGFIASARRPRPLSIPLGHFALFGDPRTDPRATRYNDGGTDRLGRYWAGTCDTAQVERGQHDDRRQGSERRRLRRAPLGRAVRGRRQRRHPACRGRSRHEQRPSV